MNTIILNSEPCITLVNNVQLNAQVDDFTDFGDSFAVHDVKLSFFERGSDFVLHDLTGHTVTLMKYSGSAWAAATETQELTYTWYAQDKDGNPITFDKTGKVIYLSAADIDSILTLQCDVSN